MTEVCPSEKQWREYTAMSFEERMGETEGARGSRDNKYGKMGTVLIDKHGYAHIRKLSGDAVRRGRDRAGIKAKDFLAEAVATNDSTVPLFDIPAVILETMRISNPQIYARDLAVYWYLFAIARLNGMAQESHSIKLSFIAKYLGIEHIRRVVEALQRLDETSVSYHFNQADHRGRKAMPLIVIKLPEGKLNGASDLEFSLPAAVRTAVLESRGHAWVSINALARFKSRCTAPVYLRLCHKAGQLAEKRKPLLLSEADMADIMDTPMSLGLVEINRRIDCVVEDLNGLNGVFKRFDVTFERVVYDRAEGEELHRRMGGRHDFVPDYADGTKCLRITAGTAARKLREVRPSSMSKSFWDLYASQTYIPQKWTPHLTRLRQAATLAHVTLDKLFTCWVNDIREAVDSYAPVAHLEAEDFIVSLDRLGADRMLEHWVEARDFGGDVIPSQLRRNFRAAELRERDEYWTAKYGPPPTWKPEGRKAKPVAVAGDYGHAFEDYDSLLADDFEDTYGYDDVI